MIEADSADSFKTGQTALGWTVTKSIKSVFSSILSLLKTLSDKSTDIVDYVVEQGTSGIWTYYKYASGRAVCKGHTSQTSISCTTAYGNAYYAAKKTQTFPSGLFNNAQKIDIGAAVWAQGGLFNVAFETWSNTQMTYYYYSPKSESRNAGISFIVEGTWK